MINILELRPNPHSKSDGIDKYCNSLCNLFCGDELISIHPVMNFPMRTNKVLKEIYVKSGIKNVLEKERIDIVHINGFASFSVLQSIWFAQRAGKKIVYTAHFHPFEYLNHPFRAKLFYFLLLRPFVKKYADVVVTINREDTAFFSKIHNNVKCIPHWIEFDSVEKNTHEKDPNMILFVGRLNDSNKGIEHLFHLPEGRYNIHCVGPGVESLRNDMVQHVDIPIQELDSLYSRASLLVVPSRYEAFSYVALEALSHGTPVLLSDRVRIADYLENVQGVEVFQYHNYEDFNKNVETFIGKEVDNSTISYLFSKQRIKGLYQELFQSVFNQ